MHHILMEFSDCVLGWSVTFYDNSVIDVKSALSFVVLQRNLDSKFKLKMVI